MRKLMLALAGATALTAASAANAAITCRVRRYAICASAGRRRRRIARPIPLKPRSISAQVPGSGTACAENDIDVTFVPCAENWKTPGVGSKPDQWKMPVAEKSRKLDVDRFIKVIAVKSKVIGLTLVPPVRTKKLGIDCAPRTSEVMS